MTILRDGKHVDTRQVSQGSHDQMVEMMTADLASDKTPTPPGSVRSIATAKSVSHATTDVAMRVAGMTRGRAVRDVSFSVYRGERLGIAGLVGSGRTELLRLIFGADTADRGEVFLGTSRRRAVFTNPPTPFPRESRW